MFERPLGRIKNTCCDGFCMRFLCYGIAMALEGRFTSGCHKGRIRERRFQNKQLGVTSQMLGLIEVGLLVIFSSFCEIKAFPNDFCWEKLIRKKAFYTFAQTRVYFNRQEFNIFTSVPYSYSYHILDGLFPSRK